MTDPMHRRQFLARAGLLAAGLVAADQLELVERLGWTRRFFPGWSRPRLYGDSLHDDTAALQAFVDGKEVSYLGSVIQHAKKFRVTFPPGSFLLDSALVLPRGHLYSGDGHRTEFVAGASGHWFMQPDSAEVPEDRRWLGIEEFKFNCKGLRPPPWPSFVYDDD